MRGGRSRRDRWSWPPRTEWYGARDQLRITALTATWSGTDLGPLARIHPPVTFGFASVPPTPAATTITLP